MRAVLLIIAIFCSFDSFCYGEFRYRKILTPKGLVNIKTTITQGVDQYDHLITNPNGTQFKATSSPVYGSKTARMIKWRAPNGHMGSRVFYSLDEFAKEITRDLTNNSSNSIEISDNKKIGPRSEIKGGNYASRLHEAVRTNSNSDREGNYLTRALGRAAFSGLTLPPRTKEQVEWVKRRMVEDKKKATADNYLRAKTKIHELKAMHRELARDSEVRNREYVRFETIKIEDAVMVEGILFKRNSNKPFSGLLIENQRDSDGNKITTSVKLWKGQMDGTFKSVHANGVVLVEGLYWYGEKEGLWIQRSLSGDRISETVYREGKVINKRN